MVNAAGAPADITITSPTTDPTTPRTRRSSRWRAPRRMTPASPSVTWVNDRGGSGAAAGTTSWTAADIPLAGGVNVITVTAKDASGNARTRHDHGHRGAAVLPPGGGRDRRVLRPRRARRQPERAAAPIIVTFLKDDGTTVTQNLTVARDLALTIHVDQIAGLEAAAVSTVVTSTAGLPLVVERTMFWDSSYYGSHGGTAVDGPREPLVLRRRLAGLLRDVRAARQPERAAGDGHALVPARERRPVTRTVKLAPTARLTVSAGAIPELVNHSFAMVVESTVPIVAERAMYFGTARFRDGGHESAGVSEPSTNWFLAEGATGPFFDTFVLVGNPNPTPATVTLTFLTDRARRSPAPARWRRTPADDQHRDESAGAGQRRGVDDGRPPTQPIVAERAMYWPGTGLQWNEAHNSFGVTGVGHEVGPGRRPRRHRQGVPDLHPAGEPEHDAAAQVRVTFLRSNGTTRGEDLHGEPDVALQRRRQQPRCRSWPTSRSARSSRSPTASASSSSARSTPTRSARSGRRAPTPSARACRKPLIRVGQDDRPGASVRLTASGPFLHPRAGGVALGRKLSLALSPNPRYT